MKNYIISERELSEEEIERLLVNFVNPYIWIHQRNVDGEIRLYFAPFYVEIGAKDGKYEPKSRIFKQHTSIATIYAPKDTKGAKALEGHNVVENLWMPIKRKAASEAQQSCNSSKRIVTKGIVLIPIRELEIQVLRDADDDCPFSMRDKICLFIEALNSQLSLERKTVEWKNDIIESYLRENLKDMIID